MSFSFNAAGSRNEVVAEVGKQTAVMADQIPGGLADAIQDQLGRLPQDAEVTLVCNGHTGWDPNQNSGQMSMHVSMDVRVVQPAIVERIVDADPEVQPGPERFPEGFAGDAGPGRAAGEAEAETDA